MNDQYLRNIIHDVEAELGTHQVKPMPRRSFVKLTGLAGGGLVLAFNLGENGSSLIAQTGDTTFTPNAFIRISPNGSILVYSKNPEIGQGIKTALPMIVAEELDANWADVVVQQSPINQALYGRQAAGGSRSIPANWDQLRLAGANARTMLVTAAAQEWGIPATECKTEMSEVIHPHSKRRLGYGELANKAAKLPVPHQNTVSLKERKDWKLLGTRVTGVDNHALVTGQPLFGIDQKVPGMFYATYDKCPATGGSVRSANLDEIRLLPGVKDAFILKGTGQVTELMPGVAIVAESTWAAFNAKRHLRVVWDETEASKDSWSGSVERARELSTQQGVETVGSSGNVEEAFSNAETILEGFYSYPFLSHATLEPQNTTAWYRDGSVEIWAPTQTPQRGISNAAKILGITEDRVTLHQTRVGGGFGRRLMNDSVCEAVAISKKFGAPIKLQWTREDDMAHDFYRVGGFHGLRGSFNKEGQLTAWQDHFVTFSADGKNPVSGGNISESEFPAPLVDNFDLTQTMLPLGTPCGPWRAPRSNGIAFAVQCFIHELAVAAGRDHLEFILDIMGQPRWLDPGNSRALNTGRAADVIKLAAEKAEWGRRLPKGSGLGLAFHFSHAGHIAEVAEVSVDDNRKITIHRVTVAADVGPIINLSGAENQCQGAVIDGLSTTLGLGLSIENGRVQESNFDQYPILRIGNAPKVDVHFIQSEHAPTGLGEPALPPIAPAVCNALFAATGHRVRELPLSKEGFSV